MKKCIFITLFLPLLAGCFSSAPSSPKYWTIGCKVPPQCCNNIASVGPSDHVDALADVRISRVDVSAPYNGRMLTVLRQDGSTAFDAYNVFSAQPAQLMLPVAEQILAQSGVLGRMVPCYSAADSRYLLEVDVTMFAMDCRVEGEKKARVELCLQLMENRKIISSSKGVGTVEMKEDFSDSFSEAFTTAFWSALDNLKLK